MTTGTPVNPDGLVHYLTRAREVVKCRSSTDYIYVLGESMYSPRRCGQSWTIVLHLEESRYAPESYAAVMSHVHSHPPLLLL